MLSQSYSKIGSSLTKQAEPQLATWCCYYWRFLRFFPSWKQILECISSTHSSVTSLEARWGADENVSRQLQINKHEAHY